MRAVLFLFVIISPAWPQIFSLAPFGGYGTVKTPVALVAADFNGDGKPDLAVANYDGNSVTVLIATDAFGFTPAGGSPFPAGSKPISLAYADFNSDGRLDIAVAGENGGVTVLLGNASDSFTQAMGSPIATGLVQSSIATGDFNGDGKPDLVIANKLSGSVTLLLGNGLGGFSVAPGSPFPAGADPRFVLVGDWNHDGKLDLAIANGDAGQVTVLLGNGAGGFAASPGSPFLVGQGPQALASSDFNKDGKLDLAVVNRVSNDVTVLLGDGAGGFVPAPGGPVSAGSYPVSAAAADFNGDGNPDIAVVSYLADSVIMLLGNGSGAFSRGTSLLTGLRPVAITTADFNRGDGRPDLAIVNSISNDVTVYLDSSSEPAKLSMWKTHAGAFAPGQIGANYLLYVANSGGLTAVGGGDVTDYIPYGLTLVSMAGPGWSCQGTLCTRRDALAGRATYPPITVTVNVSPSAPAQLTNSASLTAVGMPGVTYSDPTNIRPASGVYLSSVPAGVTLNLDGASQTTPATIGLAGGFHTLSAPKSLPAGPGAQYVFAGWGDDGTISSSPVRSILVDSHPASFTAFYAFQYQLTITASPAAAGAVTPASGTFYAAGTVPPVSVTPSATFLFSRWTGGVANPALASTTVTLNGPVTLTANLIPTSGFFVTELYRDLLSRNPDTGGFAYWTGLINTGTLPREIVASSLFTSPEFTQSGLYVIKLYVAVLGRDPDFGGWLNWFTALRSGTTPATVLNSFLASTEFQNTYGSLSNSDFVTLVYHNVLGRAPDPDGFANWLGRLNSGNLTRGDVMGAFVNGPEFDNSVRSRAYANLLYMGFLRRTADGNGLTFWTGALNAGNPLSTVIYGFINGAEYLNRLAGLTP